MRKKIKTLVSHGIDGYIEGRQNFKNPTPEIEALAKKRAEKATCLVKEPIPFFAVADERIPELSEKMCNKCGCTAAYKFRQSIELCKCWDEIP